MIQIDIKEDGTIFMTGTVGYIAEMSVAESFFSQKEDIVQNADMAEEMNKNEI